jgi:hypothetical protein
VTAVTRAPAVERRWAELLEPWPVEQRLSAMLELARAGVLSALGLDLRSAFELAIDVSAPGAWRTAEHLSGIASPEPARESAWREWRSFCDGDAPAPEVADYRSLLDERYER